MKTKKESEPLVNADAVAQYLAISRVTVYQWAKQGKLPYYQFGDAVRFRMSEIEKYIASVRISAYSELK